MLYAVLSLSLTLGLAAYFIVAALDRIVQRIPAMSVVDDLVAAGSALVAALAAESADVAAAISRGTAAIAAAVAGQNIDPAVVAQIQSVIGQINGAAAQLQADASAEVAAFVPVVPVGSAPAAVPVNATA